MLGFHEAPDLTHQGHSHSSLLPRFEDHLNTDVVDVQFVYSVQSLDRLKKKRNKYLNKLERAEVTYKQRKERKEKREQAKSQDVSFWHRYLTFYRPLMPSFQFCSFFLNIHV